jgi:N-acetylglucosaminyl-diphospho-decaprenol L-rhamnosyltransferase
MGNQLHANDSKVDLAVVVVSANDAHWLDACLTSVLDHAGAIELEIVVVDNGCTDGTRELVQSRFPGVRVVGSPNRGFAYGNNRGLEHVDARHLLLLNPDTEILHGTFQQLLATLDACPEIGLAGVRQIGSDGAPLPTIRRFPNAARALGEALCSERWPLTPAWAGERVLDPAAHEREQRCDWVSGSFMLIREQALRAAGLMDERFFLYCEETDLCRRIALAGWQVQHLPSMTIRHHAGKGGARPAFLAQDALSRTLYARKHFSPAHRALFGAAVGLRHALRSLSPRRAQRDSARLALRTLAGRAAPPFIAPPATALTPAAALASAAAHPPEKAPAGDVFGDPPEKAPAGDVFGDPPENAPAGDVFGDPPKRAPAGDALFV